MADIDINASGPWFDGRARAEIQQICREAEDEIAAQAYAEVMTFLNRYIRVPTPYYETQIVNQRITAGRRVHDRGISYGPWLESGPNSGKGPVDRPSSVGRPNEDRYMFHERAFRGYHSFAKAAAVVKARARELTEHAVRRHIGRM